MFLTKLICLVCVASVLACATSASAAAPSANADRRGSYTVHSSVNEQYNYHVGVPENYDPRHGAGIHLFFHGQGKGPGVESLNSWKSICEPNRLIAINMQFLDGNNLTDTGGKVKAAMQAVEQVIADYHIIPGRGIIASFSGGGLPHAMYAGQSSRTGPSAAWPFSCMALYGSNYWSSLAPTRKMCYFVGLGEKEWQMGSPTLGDTQTSRARELFSSSPRIGYDFVFRVEKGKAHSISPLDRQAVSAMFHRFDLAFNAFIYEPLFTDAEVRSLAHRANQLQLGGTLKSLTSLLAKVDLDATQKQQAQLLLSQVQARADEVLKLAQSLADTDPLLFSQYQQPFSSQLAGTPREPAWKQTLEQAGKKWPMTRVAAATQLFCQLGPHLFNSGSPVLDPQSLPTLKSLLPVLGPDSSAGKMISEWLLLAPAS